MAHITVLVQLYILPSLVQPSNLQREIIATSSRHFLFLFGQLDKEVTKSVDRFGTQNSVVIEKQNMRDCPKCVTRDYFSLSLTLKTSNTMLENAIDKFATCELLITSCE